MLSNHIYKLLLSVLVLFTISCTRPDSTKSKIQITTPKASSSLTSKVKKKLVRSSLKQSAKVGKLEIPYWGLTDPTAISEIGCYAVFIGGPSDNLKESTCSNHDGNPVMSFGPVAGLVAPGEKVTFDLETGPDRVIYVVGFAIDPNYTCEQFGQSMTTENYSNPFLVGKTVATLKPGDQAVTVNISDASLADSANKIGDCSFFGSDSSGGGYYGTGADGNLVGSGSVLDLSTATVTDPTSINFGKVLSPSGRVMSIATDANSDFILELDSNWASKVSVWDSVVLNVVAASGVNSCGVNGVYPGFTYEVPVMETNYSGLNNKILVPGFDPRWGNVPAANLQASAVGNGATPFCRIQIVRVPQLRNLTLSGQSITNSALGSLSASVQGAGMVFLKVSGSINVPSGNNDIDVVGLGYAGGASGNYSGESYQGKANSNLSFANASGGGGGPSTAGGGGHGGLAGSVSGGSSNGGFSAGDTYGGNFLDPEQVILMGKIYSGGGGGGNTGTAGGAGGGIIVLLASEINISAIGARFQLNASGVANASGGAGGTVYLESDYINNIGSLEFTATGGVATGGGAGGRIDYFVSNYIGNGAVVTKVMSGSNDSASGTVMGHFAYQAPVIFAVDHNNQVNQFRYHQSSIGSVDANLRVQFETVSSSVNTQIAIYDQAGTLKGGCSTTVPSATSSVEFNSGCGLAAGNTYIAKIVALDAASDIIAKNQFYFQVKPPVATQTLGINSLVAGSINNSSLFMNDSSFVSSGGLFQVSGSMPIAMANASVLTTLFDSSSNPVCDPKLKTLGSTSFTSTYQNDWDWENGDCVQPIDGSYVLNAILYDDAGNEYYLNANPDIAFEIDTVAPVTPIAQPSFTCSSWGASLASLTNFTLNEPGNSYDFLFSLANDSIADNSYPAVTNPATVPFATSMPDSYGGTFYLMVSAKDDAGNQTPGPWTSYTNCPGLW